MATYIGVFGYFFFTARLLRAFTMPYEEDPRRGDIIPHDLKMLFKIYLYAWKYCTVKQP